MIINKPHLCTVLEILAPKYHGADGNWEAWLSKNKVDHASPVIIVNFSAKHLKGQRFAVRRDVARDSRVASNGKIDVYCVKWADLESWESGSEVSTKAKEIFKDV